MKISEIMGSVPEVDILSVLNVVAPNSDDTFDSHDFIEEFCKQQEHTYIIMLVAGLCKKMSSIHHVHTEIGKWLSTYGQIRKHSSGKVSTYNIHGNETANQSWERI